MHMVVDATNVVFIWLSAVMEMDGRKKRWYTVSVASLKTLFYALASDMRHTIGGEFAQIAWGADLGHKGDSVTAAPMYTMIDGKNVKREVGTVC